MKRFSKIMRYISDSSYRFDVNASYGLCNWMNDEEYIKRMFKLMMGYEIDLENPKTFNEKLQWLKLHDRKPLYTQMVDKYEVKKYVSSLIGDEFIIPTIGVWDRFDEIDFNSLPDRFVLKCTHDSGGLAICEEKNVFDKDKAKSKIERSLKKNFFYYGREWPYKDVKPRIIAEDYMEDSATAELRDYKFFCFNGEVKCFKIDFDRFVGHRANYYSYDGSLMQLGEVMCPPDFEKKLDFPAQLELMKFLAEKLSKGFPFIRVDLYEVNGKVYFGELTFYPASGFGKFIYEGNDELLGSWITIPV